MESTIHFVGTGGRNILSGPNRNPLNCKTLGNWVFENFVLDDEPFAKSLQIFQTYVLVDKNLRGKLVSSLEFLVTFDERFQFTSISFLIPDFNLLSCELDNVAINVLYLVTLILILW